MFTRRQFLRCASAWSLLFAGVLSPAGCGYRVAGRGNALPAEWKSIAVPALVNRTSRFRIEQRLTEALIRELLARTAYRVVQDESRADGVLRGEVLSIETSAVLFDAATGRATTVLVTVRLNARLTDRASGKVHYLNENFVFREQYEISTGTGSSADLRSFFEEQEPALGRLARDFAAALVSAVLENF